MAAKKAAKPNPFAKMMKSEKGETMKMEKKESPKFEKKEKKMGTEKPMPFKCGGKVKGK